MQNALGKRGLGPQDLQGGDEPVAAKYSVEPGDTRVGISAFRIADGHHLQVRFRASKPFRKSFIRTGHATEPRIERFVQTLGFAERLPVTTWRAALTAAYTTHIEIYKCLRPRLNFQFEAGVLGLNVGWLRIKIQSCFAHNFIEATVSKLHACW